MAFKRDISWDGVAAIVAVAGALVTIVAKFDEVKADARDARAKAEQAVAATETETAERKAGQDKIWDSMHALSASQQTLAQNQAVLTQVVQDHLTPGPKENN